MYYIYHIPNVKVGCSINPNRRVKAQGYNDFQILAEAADKLTAGNLEVQFQKQYGYKVDCVKYYQANYKSMGHKGGTRCVELGHTKKLQEIGSKIAAALPRTEAQMEQARKIQKIGAKIAWSKPRSEAQMKQIRNAQKIGCVIGGKIAGAIMKEKLRVPIAVYKKSDNTYVGEYPSVADCARELNLTTTDIFNCLNPNKVQYSTKGYKFVKLKK